MPQDTKIKTYVIIGEQQDHRIAESYRNGGDVVIVPKKGDTAKSIADQVVPPANVLLYTDSFEIDKKSFLWNGEHLAFADLEAAFKSKDIRSITFAVCEPGTAVDQNSLRLAPSGAIVHTIVDEKHLSPMWLNVKLAGETYGAKPSDKMNFILKKYDNFDGELYRKTIDGHNKSEGTHADNDPQRALPTKLYIAGNYPQTIDLDVEMKAIRKESSFFQSTLTEIRAYFDAAGARLVPGSSTDYILTPNEAAANKTLHTLIDKVADNLTKNVTPQSVDERRIAYAFTAEYLEESGKLQRYVDHARPCDAEGKPIPVSNAPVKENITPDEQAYLTSVKKTHKLTDDEMATLKAVFKSTPVNDTFPKDGAQDKALTSKHLSTKGWAL